jgi:hypothetical protein
MARSFNPTALIPPGVVMESVDDTGTAMVIKVRSSTSVGDCPSCGSSSRRVHSRYTRILADLPLSGRPVSARRSMRAQSELKRWDRLRADGLQPGHSAPNCASITAGSLNPSSDQLERAARAGRKTIHPIRELALPATQGGWVYPVA